MNKHTVKMILDSILIDDIFRDQDIMDFKLIPNQGLNNLVYILNTSCDRYIVKKYKKSLYKKIDRENECKIQKIASLKSLCYEPILFDKDSSLLIYKFIDAKHKTSLNGTNLKSLATALKKLHNIKFYGRKFKIKRYFETHDIDKKLANTLRELKRYKKDFVLSHNDLNPKNVLFTSSVKFIDWEYASLNDRYFDLAAICIEFKLSSKKEKIFVALYFKNIKINYKKLHIFKIIYKYVCYTWLKKQELICKKLS